MPYQVKFDFARPLSPRVVDVLYISPPICGLYYYSSDVDTFEAWEDSWL
jgi:hypothetical protein